MCFSSTHLSNNVLTASADCAIQMSTISHIKRRIRQRRIKQQQRGSGPIPKTDDFEIPEKYYYKGDDFLFEDKNVQQSEKVSGLWKRIQFAIAQRQQRMVC